MKIVIDYEPLYKKCFSDHFSRYVTNAILSLQDENPDVEIVVASGKMSTEKFPFTVGSENLVMKKIWPGIAGWKFWYHRQLPNILKETNAELLITTGIASGDSKVPQCVWMPAAAKHCYIKKKYFSWTSKKIEKSIINSKIIFTDSESGKKNIVEAYPASQEKIIVVPYTGEKNACVISWEERESVKTQCAAGKEYFLIYRDDFSLEEFILLLKAFSRFKKKQLSNIQLIIAGITKQKKFAEKLDGFKYRSDVHFYDEEKKIELEKIFAAAYGLLLPLPSEISLLNSFSRRVPVITSKPGYPSEMDNQAVLFANFLDSEELANQLILLYKDERLRNSLIVKGKMIATKFSREQQKAQLWKGIKSALVSV